MKVLVINTVPTEKNGITNVIFNYMEAISHQDIQMDLLMINEAEQSYKDRVAKCGGESIVLCRSAKNILIYLIKLSRIINKNKYDAVHIHGNSHTMILELLAAKLGGCKVRITHSHNTTCNSITLHKLLTPVFNSLYSHGLACGKEAGFWQYGNRPFTVINNGVDTDRFAFNESIRKKIRETLGVSDKETLMGHVGYFLPLKNQKFIVDILSVLDYQFKNYKLLLIGDGELRSAVEKQVHNLGLQEKVVFTGNIDNVSDYLNAIDMILMPSLYEGLPLSLIEQQANGLQCVCSDTITKEADKTGNLKFLSLKKNESEWAQEVIDFIKLEGREQRSLKAIIDIKKSGYSIQEEASKLLKFYNSVKI